MRSNFFSPTKPRARFALALAASLAVHVAVLAGVALPGVDGAEPLKNPPLAARIVPIEPQIAPPVKQAAMSHHLPVAQFTTLRDPAVHEAIARWRPDLVVVAAYGKILPPPVLAIPPHGCVNVHASLLPHPQRSS